MVVEALVSCIIIMAPLTAVRAVEQQYAVSEGPLNCSCEVYLAMPSSLLTIHHMCFDCCNARSMTDVFGMNVISV